MKRILTSLAALTALTSAVSAADLPRRSPPPVFTPVPVFSWSGFYAGVNVGYVWSDDRVRTVPTFDPNTTLVGAVTQFGITTLGLDNPKFNQSGVTAGAQAGYNYQFTPGSGFVVGLETDIQYTDMRNQRTVAADVPVFAGLLSVNLDNTSTKNLSYLGTVRGRLGYAFDRFMVYGTGGFAYGLTDYVNTTNIGATFLGVPTGPLLFVSGDRRAFDTGFAYGGGIEYAMPEDNFLNFFKANAVTLKVEYLHYDLGSKTVTGSLGSTNPLISAIINGTVGPVALTASRVHNEGNIVRVGLNYKFGS